MTDRKWIDEWLDGILAGLDNYDRDIPKAKSQIIKKIEERERALLEEFENLLTEADHSQTGEWTSWEVQAYVSVLRNLIKERMKK